MKFSKSINVMTDEEDSAAEKSGSEDETPDVHQVNMIRTAGRNYICTVVSPCGENMQLLVDGGALIKHETRCNEEVYDAIFDTVAFISTIYACAAAEYGWRPQKCNLKLYHALGEKMTSLSSVELEVSITLGGITREIKHHFVVVRNLYTRIIIGVELIRKIGMVIRATEKQPLAFSKQPRKKGVRAKEIVLPPKSLTIVEGSVEADAKLVVVTPFGFDNAIPAAHALCRIKDRTVRLPVINTDPKPVRLEDGVQVAAVQSLPAKSFSGGDVNAVLPIGTSDTKSEVVHIGDNLTADQVVKLEEVLVKNVDAFSVNGQIGLVRLYQHRIELCR